eukprot:CAMPEP_0202919160 /NCGR_PEP_ID=MMETSP1392-20130828/75176_1 /ASSEMBLY_ACC=CAM_ASM_000868 /TAXON_ID=225041 /ORGANISM="Chlamydomonas chlamydogama, Strain SAG 11-48b" /LENGTH=43 /DNA_ID= /DNA_START= /DNA_END= /DNA_ORIENTATION=
MSHFYIAFGMEQVLIDELPSYVPSSSDHHAAGPEAAAPIKSVE